MMMTVEKLRAEPEAEYMYAVRGYNWIYATNRKLCLSGA